MKWIDYFLPDEFLPSVTALDTEKAWEEGIRVILFDIDNTLVPYDVPVADEALSRYLLSLRERGFFLALISNNNSDRVDKFNEAFGFFSISDAGKPSTAAVHRALTHFGVEPRELLVVGDQLLTDVLAARRAGCAVVAVEPIKKKESLFFSFKRMLEKPLKKFYEKRRSERK